MYSTYLTLRTTRTNSFQSAAEIDSTAINYHYLSARFLARVVGDTGSCAGIFTWLCDTGSCSTTSSNVEEGDVEILTSGPQHKIQLTNQPSESPSGDTLPLATLNATLPSSGEWTTWNEYRYDWLPGLSSWYVNGVSVGNISFQAPKNPASLILNMWSDGGSWTGKMRIGGVSYLQIQWIEVVYNTSAPTATGSKLGRDILESMQQASVAATSQENDPFDPSGELSASLISLQNHGRRATHHAASSSCRNVCSIDTNVTTRGSPSVISMATQASVHQSIYLLIIPLILLHF